MSYFNWNTAIAALVVAVIGLVGYVFITGGFETPTPTQTTQQTPAQK